MNLKTLVKLSLSMLLFVAMLSGVSFAQLSKVYVDVTNGANSNTGENPTNNPAGTGPKHTLAGGLGALADNGTLVVFAGTYNGVNGSGADVDINSTTYTNLTHGLTIELRSLNSNNLISLSGGNFIFNIPNGTLNITTTSATEYLSITSGLTLTAGNINIPLASNVRMVSGSTITVNGTSAFTNAAPSKGTDLNLTYTGTGSFTAGPEAKLGNYGAGVLTVNKASGTVTFDNSFTFTGAAAITVSSGSASFVTNVTAGAGDIVNTGAGTVTFNGPVAFSVTNGAADANLGSVENTAGGSIVFNGAVTWSPVGLTADRTFAAGVGTYLVYNAPTANAGSVLFNSSVTLVAPANATANNFNVYYTALNDAANGGHGTLTFSSISAPNSGSAAKQQFISINNNAGANSVLNLGASTIAGTLTNAASGTVNLTGASTIAALTNAGTVNVSAPATVTGILTNSGTVALGTNTLTLSGNVAHATNGGTVTATTGGIAVTANTGANSFDGGTLSNLAINGSSATTFQTNAVNVTNLSVPSGSVTVSIATTAAGTITMNGGNITVGAVTLTTKNFTQSAGTLTLADNALSILSVNGDFNRTAGTFTAGAASIVKFTGATAAQSFNGGPLLQLGNLDLQNTAGTINVGQSVRVYGVCKIYASTNVALGSLNIILNAAGAVMDNNGTYSANGGGGIIFGGSTTVSGGVAAANMKLRGTTGLYSYITVDVGAANVVTVDQTNQKIKFTGVLTLTSGDLKIDAGAGNAVDFAPSGTSASIIRNMAATGSNNGIVVANSGTFNNDVPTDYDLQYTGVLTGNASVATGTSEYDADNVRNLTVSTTTAGANTLTLTSGSAVTVKGNLSLTGATTKFVLDAGTPYDVEVKGQLSVVKGAVLSGGSAAKDFVLSGDAQAHSVVGTLSAAQDLIVTGSGSSITGSTDAAAAASINNLNFEPAADNASFTSTNLKNITNALTVEGTSTKTGASATVTMNAVDATLGGALTVGNGTTTPTVAVTIAGTNTSSHGAAIDLNNGSLTYTRNSVGNTVSTVTLTKGTLTLGSNVVATGAVSQAAGNLNLGAYNLTVKNDYTRTAATGSVTGTGTLVIDATGGARTVTPFSNAFSVPNIEFIGAGNGITVGAEMNVTNSVTHTSGAVALGDLKFSGNTYNFVAGSNTGALTLTGSNPVITATANMSVPTLTLNSTGTLTFASNKDANTDGVIEPVSLTVGTAFLQTAGNVVTSLNDVIFGGTFTRVAGTWSQTTGTLEFNTAGAVDLGDGFAIDNMKVTQSVDFGTKAYVVNKNLIMAGGTITTSADGKMTLGNSSTIERQANTATLSKLPTFGTDMNLKYTTLGGAITTAKEFPATVNNLTVNMPAGGSVVLAASVTVNGTLSLNRLLNATNGDPGIVVTMADNSTLELKANGTTVLDEALTKAGKLNLVYNGATATTTRELGPTTNATTHTAGNVTIKAGPVVLDNPATFTGTLTFNGSDLDQNGNDLFVQGDVTEASGAGWFAPAALSNLYFNGAVAQTLTLKTDKDIPANLNFVVNKTNIADKVTLAGGNMNFATNSKTLNLTKGVLVTGTNVITLKQSAAASQPVQGFARTSGAVVGNVKKLIVAGNSVDISRVEFPTGTVNGEYRPLSIYFKTAPSINVNLTVNHVNAKAGGNNGFPITAGSKQITNYPDFFWYVKSDQALAPSYKYDMDAMAEGYTDYTKDQIQNVRFVRRDSGSVSNQWVMQGADNAYDNSTVSLTKPVVKVIDAMGGITSQGSIFSYSQSNKAPVFTAALTNVAKNEGDTLSGTFTSVDPDFNQTVTLSAVTLPTGATFDAATGKVNWVIGYDVATKTTPSVAKTVTIRSTDNMGAYRDTTVTVTVNNKNRLPVVAKMGAKNVAENVAFEYQYSATDADGEAVTYSMNITGDATVDSAKISTSGKLTWTPGFGNAGKVALLNVNVTDGIGTTTVVDTITVTKTNRAPVFTAKVDTATIPMGSVYSAAFTATDPDANTLVYSVTGDDTTATINAATGVFTWTPAYKTAGGVYNFTVKATDNGSPALSVTTSLKLTVTLVNAAPVFTATLNADTVAVGDTLKFKYVATDANGDALTYALVNAPLGATINAATGDFTWIPQASQTAIYVIKTTVTDGKIATPVVTSKEVLVKVVTVAVSGKVTYDGSTKGVPGVEVTLTPTTGTAIKATTDASGNYSINNVTSGTYTIKASKTTGWGGVTAGDALLAALFGLDATANPLSAAQKLAADVNGNSSVNAVDAGLIVSKYVDNNTAFVVPNWLFVTDASVTVGSKAVTSNITAIAAGDVNRSLANGTIAKNAPSVSTSEEQKIAPKASFTLPIKVAEDAKLGSASIQFTYPVDLVKFEGVIGASGMVSNDVNGTVTIAWFDTKGMNLKAGEVLAGLKFTATEKFAKGQSFTVSVDNSSELTDVKGQPVSLALSVANVTVAVPQAFALNQNYPNPFNPTTTISYDLPVDGKVTLSIYNSIGELVTTLVNEIQTAGSYKFNWNAASMSSGVYLYRITVDGQKAYSSTQKMVLMK